MAAPTFLQAKTLTIPAAGLQPESINERILSMLAILASGQNPDGSAGGVAVSGSVSIAAAATNGYSYHSSLANETVLIKTGSGFLHTVSLASYGSGTLTLYDNTLGTGAIITQLNPTFTCTFTYDLEFTTGLYVVVTGATQFSATITYK